MNAILRAYLITIALHICGVLNAQNAMCPDITDCMMTNGHVVNVSVETLPMCIDGGQNIPGDFSTGVCLQPGTELSCTAYVFTRGPKSDVTSIGGPIGQGNGCNGQIDELLFQYVDPLTNSLVCFDVLDPAGGSQINADVVFPSDLDDEGNWVVTELIIWVCANSNSFPTICSACANDPTDCTGCDTDDDITRTCDDGVDCTINDFEILDNCGFICTPCSGTDMCTMCDLEPPTITVIDNTCDPEMDGFYEITTDCGTDSNIEFSTDNGATWSTTLPTYPEEFLARCSTGEMCEVISYEGLDPMEDAVDQVNMGTVMLGGATLSIVQTFNGTSFFDENVITASQTTGDVGISSGVSHSCNENSCGLIDNSMNNQYLFTEPVCNLTIDLWDLDRDDEMVLVASGPNGPVTYTVNTIGTGVTQSGNNTFSSNNPNANYPGDGPATLGMFSITFDDCVTQIEIDYYDMSDTAGDGGSYTIVFQEGCTISDCISEEIAIVTNPQVCPTCLEDLVANLVEAGPVCDGAQINFDGTGSTPANVEYQWDFENDGTVDITTTTPMASFTYPSPGIFTVSMTVVDPTGNCDPATTTIQVEICGAAVVVCPPSPLLILEGESIDTADLGSPIVTGSSCTTNIDITFEDVIGPGDCDLEEVITRVFTITEDCSTFECIQIIDVEDIDELFLTPDLAIPDPVCFGETVTLDASGSTGFADLTYDWDFNGDGIIDQTTTTGITTTTFTTPGTYTVFVTITAPTSPCPIPSASTSIEIIICDQIMVTCPVETVTITDGDSIDPSVLGEPQFTTNECNPNPTYTFQDVSSPATCPFEEIIVRTFTITDNCGDQQCIQTINIEVDNPADINALPINPEICLGDVITLDASASVGDGLTYCWDVGIGSAACDYTTPTASHVYTESGMYIITLMITDQFGCTDELTIGTVTVYEAPSASADMDFDPCTLTLIYDGTASIDNTPPDNLIYTWDFGDGNTSGTASGTHVFDNCNVVGPVTLTIVDPDVPFAACNSDMLIFTFDTDMEPPVLICPDPIDINCGDPIPSYEDLDEFIAAGGTATDNCDILEFNQVSLDTIPGNCPYIYQVEIVYEALDICENRTTCSQIINILPELPSGAFPDDVVLSCGDDISPDATGSPIVTSNSCTRPVTVTMEDVLVSGSCPGDVTITRTWTLTDDCGNIQTHVQIIVIINDIIPVLEGPPDITIDNWWHSRGSRFLYAH